MHRPRMQKTQTIILYAEELSDNTSTEEIIKPEKYSYGDFNHDGSLNVFDLMHCRQYLLNNNEQPLDIADMDGNGAFNFHDDSVLKGYLLLKDDEYSRKISSSVSNPDLKDSEKYNYVLFAGSKEADALTVIANTVTNNNIVAANSECNIFAKKSGSGSFVDDAGISIVRMNNKITEKYFCDAVEYSEIDTSEANISLDRPVYSYDGIYIENIDDLPTALINNVCMMAINDIDIDCDSDNELNATLYSKYGNVRIDCNNININGLIYAPYGSVELTANNININGAIIAKKVYINGTDQVNLNCDMNISEFIGINSESMIIPYEDWDYMPRRNDSFFPDIVEEQILEDPLSVDDEWLYDYYGEEVTDEYAGSKEDLVNYLYMSQIDDIDNYDEIIDVLYDASVNGTSENIKLNVSDGNSITVNAYGRKINVEKEKTKFTYDHPIGPPTAPEIYVYETEDGKKIKDISTYIELLASGILMVGKGISDGVTAVGATVTSAGAAVVNTVKNIGSRAKSFLKRTGEDIAEALNTVSDKENLETFVKEKFEGALEEVGDIELFDYKIKLDDGKIIICSDDFSMSFIKSEENWNVSLTVKDDEILSDVSVPNISDITDIFSKNEFTQPKYTDRPGTLKGKYTNKQDKGLRAQDHAADILVKNGYDVEILEEVNQTKDHPAGNGYGIVPKGNPDFLINEKEVFDCYAPIKQDVKLKTIIKEIKDKTKNQARRIILNLEYIPKSRYDEIQTEILKKATPTGDLKRLDELIAIVDGNLEWWYVRS